MILQPQIRLKLVGARPAAARAAALIGVQNIIAVSPGARAPSLIVCGVRAGLPMTVPLPAIGAKGHDRACARRVARALHPRRPAVVTVGHRQQ